MSNVYLSFCIPSYNRPERIHKILEQLLNLKTNEIEIVIGDDNPNHDKIRKVVEKFNDHRINYFKNKDNLGIDGNILRVVKKAKGEFIFLLMDEDDVEVNNIPWIINVIKKHKNISQICGRIGDKRKGKNPIYFKHKKEDIILSRGFQSLRYILFWYPHGSGIILRKSVINLKKSMDYNGFLYIQQALIAQALVAGDTILTSKVFAYIGEIEYKSHQPLYKGNFYYEPLSRILQARFKIQIIYDITKGMNYEQIIRNQLLIRPKNMIIDNLTLLKNSFKDFMHGIKLISRAKLSKSPFFWIYVFINIVLSFFDKVRIIKWFLEILKKYYLKSRY